jgi:hypothetical protein
MMGGEWSTGIIGRTLPREQILIGVAFRECRNNMHISELIFLLEMMNLGLHSKE